MYTRHVIAALAVLAAASGCRDHPPAERALRVLLQFPVRAADPQTVDDVTTLAVLANVHEPLVAFDPAGRLVPRLAESWTNPSDLVWRFRLREGVRFHDGRELTAEDVKATFDRGLTHQDSWIRAQVPLLAEAKVVSRHVVDLTTRRPAPILLNQLTAVGILPAGTTGDGPFPGTGPYRVREWTAERVRLERFSGYAGPPPAWPAADLSCVRDAGQRLLAVRDGRADLAEAPRPQDLAALAAESLQVVRHPSLRIALLGFDVRPGSVNPFRDVVLRRAVARALDRRALVEEARPEFGVPVAQLAPPGVFGAPFGVDVPPPDVRAARAEVEQSGAARPIRAALLFGAERTGALAHAVARQVAAAGIELAPEWHDRAEFDRLALAGQAPAYVVLMTFPNRDASDLLTWGLHSRRPDLGYGLLNFPGHDDPALDALIQASETELRPARRAVLLQEALRAAHETHVWIPLCTLDALYVAGPEVAWPGSADGRLRLAEIGRTTVR